jgi:hypothetical protein
MRWMRWMRRVDVWHDPDSLDNPDTWTVMLDRSAAMELLGTCGAAINCGWRN